MLGGLGSMVVGTAAAGALGTLYVKLTADSTSLVKGMKTAETSVVAGATKMSGALGLLAAAAAAAAAAITLKLVKSAIDAADQMGKTAQKAGQAVDQFSALAYAAELADVSQAELAQSTKFLNQWMEKTGMSSSNLTETIIEQADKFASMEDGAAKLKMAYDRFGRSGAQMIPLLNQGSAALRAQMEEAKQLGAVISKDFSGNAQTFNDNLKRIESAFKGIFNQVADELLPVWIDLQERFIQWIKDTDAVRIAADAIIASFHTVYDAINYMRLGFLTITTVLRTVATIISTNVMIQFEVLRNGINAIIQLCGIWWDVLKNLMRGLVQMGSLVGDLGNVMSALFRRDFAAVGLGIQQMGMTVAKGWDDISTAVADGVTKSAKVAEESFSRSVDVVSGLVEGGISDIKDQWTEWAVNGAKIMEPMKRQAKDIQDTVKKTTQDIQDNSDKLTAALQAMGAPKSRLEATGLTEQQAQGLGVNPALMKQLTSGFQKPTSGIPEAAALQQFTNEEQILKDKMAVIEDIYNQEGQLTEEAQKRKIEALKAYNDQLAQLKMAEAQVVLGTSSKMFDDLASMAAAFGGKQSATYKAMFAMSKAFAIAESTVKIMQGIASAAALPWPANLGAMASVIAATASIVSTIQSTKLEFAGEKAEGGPVTGGKAYLVGERGPEMFVPGASGNITPNDMLGGGGPQVKVIINNHTDARPEVTERTEGNQKIIEVVIKRVKSELTSEIRDGRGDVNKAMESTFGLRRGRQ